LHPRRQFKTLYIPSLTLHFDIILYYIYIYLCLYTHVVHNINTKLTIIPTHPNNYPTYSAPMSYIFMCRYLSIVIVCWVGSYPYYRVRCFHKNFANILASLIIFPLPPSFNVKCRTSLPHHLNNPNSVLNDNHAV